MFTDVLLDIDWIESGITLNELIAIYLLFCHLLTNETIHYC